MQFFLEFLNMLSIKKASNYIGCHPQTLRRWEKEGKITPFYTDSNQRRYNRRQLDKLIKNNTNRKKIIYCRVSSKKQDKDLLN